VTNEWLAFERTEPYRGFTVKAFWGDEPDARVEVFKDGVPYKTFTYPAYRVFNIQAHFTDMVENDLDGMSGEIAP